MTVKTEAAKAKWEVAKQMKADGRTHAEIARELKVTPGRVSQVLGQRRVKPDVQQPETN